MATIDCRSERLRNDDEHATPTRPTVVVHRPPKESLQQNVTTGGRVAAQIYSPHNELQSNYDLFEAVQNDAVADANLDQELAGTAVPASASLEANNCSPSLIILSASSNSSTSSSSPSCSLISSKCPSFSISSTTSSTSAFSSPSVERKCLKEIQKTCTEQEEDTFSKKLARITFDDNSLSVPTFDEEQAAAEDDRGILHTTMVSSKQRTHTNQLHVVHTLNSFVGVAGRRGVTSGFGSQVPIAAFINPTNWLLCRRFQESGDTFNSLPLFVFATSTTTRSISADGIGVSKALLPVKTSAQFHILHHRQQRLRVKVSVNPILKRTSSIYSLNNCRVVE